ncbi:hypothetical protein Dalk_3583 [Desulfatibacillum aliphaticivorans]|uniref:Uncharacterized protein n=1 Tax=Desulfatibacillum aliphaticivorans TaxID=218208 RepID=B8FGP1_DESAL|nr:hypothetical protein [Desulfatibacillum aliphaticivorans]ACL05271.1 hypothetical protein Dalk_3583 [Desulfatibacillum aliphaticivorans]
MSRTKWLQETRIMRFLEAYSCWTESRLSQTEAARLLGMSDRTFPHYVDRCQEEGEKGVWKTVTLKLSFLFLMKSAPRNLPWGRLSSSGIERHTRRLTLGNSFAEDME